MKQLWMGLIFCTSVMFSQSMDYNTKKGFVAEGYDVVAYFDNHALEGNNSYISTYDGVKFKFVSKAHMDEFNMNPEKYIPKYGGYCAYAIADNGKKIGIDPETFEIRDGNLYLFYHTWLKDTYKSWKKENPELLKKKADENWNAILNE